MKIPNRSVSPKDKIVEMLGLHIIDDYDLIASHYHQRRDAYQAQMKSISNIRERIKLQNMMIMLDDAFLEYQSSLRK